MSQIDQLRKQFNGYNNTQKKQFIDNLKAKLQTNKSPEYSKFLNECVQKYNTSLREGNSSSNTFDDLLDDASITKSTSKKKEEGNISISTLKLWVTISVAVGIISQFIVPFANFQRFTENRQLRFVGWVNLDSMTFNDLIFGALQPVYYGIMIILAIFTVILISSDWDTKRCFTTIVSLQSSNLALYLYILFVEAMPPAGAFGPSSTRNNPTAYGWLIIVPIIISIVLSRKGYKRCRS